MRLLDDVLKEVKFWPRTLSAHSSTQTQGQQVMKSTIIIVHGSTIRSYIIDRKLEI